MTEPKISIRSDCLLPVDAKKAMDKAMAETGKTRRDIIAEAIEDWLVNCGYLGEEYFDRCK